MGVKKPDDLKVAAVVTIHHAKDMDRAGRRAIAKWLRKCADSFGGDPEYASIRHFRYWYKAKRA